MMEPIIQKKICLIGDFATGKTSLVRRFVYNIFEDRYLSTLGVNISRKSVNLPSNPSEVRLLIWDLSGNEKFDGTRSDYLRGAAGALFISDLTRIETVSRLLFFHDYFQSIRPESPFLIIGNKSDLVEPESSSIAQVEKISDSLKCPSLITSAKTGLGVELAFQKLTEMILKPNE